MDVPVALPDCVQAQLVRQLGRRHGVGQILQSPEGSINLMKEVSKRKLSMGFKAPCRPARDYKVKIRKRWGRSKGTEYEKPTFHKVIG